MSWALVTFAVTTAASLYQAKETRVNASRSLRQQQAQAASAQQAADEANNKANAKRPDVAGLMSAAGRASGGGQAGTLLTGPQGIDPTSLTLGRSTLLGGGR